MSRHQRSLLAPSDTAVSPKREAIDPSATLVDRRAIDVPGALIIGGDYRGLGIVRSLGRQGIPVWVLRDGHAVAASSRYARKGLRWPDGAEAHRVDYLIELAQRHRLDNWALIPTGDDTTSLVSRNHHALAEYFRLTTPPWDVTRWALDKRLTYRLAERLGIDYPTTHWSSSRADIEGLEVTFPAILKPATRERVNHLTTNKAWRVESRRELLARYDEGCTLMAPDEVMVQELIPDGGEQLSYAALCSDGVPLASITARRTRQLPMDFGRFSTAVETIDEPEVEQVSRQFLAALDFTGLVELEFKRDPRSGRCKLLDVNPRIWGWASVGARAGVDFPYLLWRLAQRMTVPNLRARPGVRWVRLSGDLPAAGPEIVHGRLSLTGYLRSLRPPIEFAIFAFDDPLPALVETLTMPGVLRRGRFFR